MTDELIVRREGTAGFLSLNRPKAIHALTAAMDEAMQEALLVWRDTPDVHVVILDHSEGRLVIDRDPFVDRINRSPVFVTRKHPVPYVLLVMPLSKQPCPINAAC